jgi:hypothetical protein
LLCWEKRAVLGNEPPFKGGYEKKRDNKCSFLKIYSTMALASMG